MIHHVILRIIGKSLIPFILMFGLYVQFHGDFGPGGGFQAGVIFAAGFIFYTLLYGLENAQKVVPMGMLMFLVPLGVMVYAGVGVLTMLKGAEFLNYDVLAHDPKHGQHLGIFWVELGVGITVAAVMVLIFYMFAGRGRN